MRPETLKRQALGLPQTTVIKQWGDNLVFKVAGKMFLLLSLDGEVLESAAFKCEAGVFKRLTDLDGIIPAPYLARASWVCVDDFAAVPAAELQHLINESYKLVVARLPKRIRAQLDL